MNPHRANLINAVCLILISMWIYYDAINPNIILLFPLLVGIVLLSLNNGVLYGYKEQIYAAVFLTILGILLLSWTCYRAYTHDDNDLLLMNSIMMLTCIVSFVYLVIDRLSSPKKIK